MDKLKQQASAGSWTFKERSLVVCYEYDWMQKPQEEEELRKRQEKLDLLKKQSEKIPPTPAEARTEEPAPV